MKKFIIFFLFLPIVISATQSDGFYEEQKLISNLKNNVPKYLSKLKLIIKDINRNDTTYSELLNGMEMATALYLAVDSKAIKLRVVEIGYKIARSAVVLSPERGEGYYYLGIFTGFIGFIKGVQYILNYLPIVDKWSKKAIQYSPSFHNGSPYVLRCAIYFEAPGFPLSIGNLNKAEKFCSIAKRNYPVNCTSYLYLATIKDIYGNKIEAKKIVLFQRIQ